VSLGPLGSNGALDGAMQVPSVNCDERPEETPVTLLIVHSISLPPGQFGGDAVVRLFTNSLDYSAHPYFETLRDLRVSAHFLIRREGEVLQFVPCTMRAWHAGLSNWQGRERCNDFSIGVELEGADDVVYAERQYARLAELTVLLRDRHPIVDIVGHADIAPGRKTDPGPAFDWARYRECLGLRR
jgi:N-acetyl-anhydromuramoyl-L-alanine amidase